MPTDHPDTPSRRPFREAAGAVAPSARKRAALELFAALPRRYDTAGAIMGLGQDARWRRTMVAAVEATDQERVLDVATGTGLVARELVRRYGCTVVGIDQSSEMLSAARLRLRREPSLGARVSLLEGEAERLPFEDASFDHLTFTYLLRYVDDPGGTLRELARVVRPGGRVASLEFGVPTKRVPRALWGAYTRFGLPAVGRLFSAEWAQTGSFLARSIPELYAHHPLERLVELWRAAGIGEVRVQPMSLGAGVVMWGTRG